MTHSINLLAEDLARQVKKHRDKRRARPRRGASARGAARQPEPGLKHLQSVPVPLLPSLQMTILDRALRVGEGKKFKTFEKVVARINDYEAELELDSDEELGRAMRRSASAT